MRRLVVLRVRWGWVQVGILSIMSRTAPLHCVIHEFFIREIADQILEFLGSIISFACGIQARLAGGKIYCWHAVFTIYYICLATKISSELTEFDNLTSVINNLLPSWPPADSSLAVFQPIIIHTIGGSLTLGYLYVYCLCSNNLPASCGSGCNYQLFTGVCSLSTLSSHYPQLI